MRRARFAQLHRYGIALMAVVLLVVGIGCEDTKEFNADELFSLEDMPKDWDYAFALIDMMDHGRSAINVAVPHLGANINSVPFADVLPEGWSKEEVIFTYTDSISWENPLDTLEIPDAESNFDQRFADDFARIGWQNSELIDSHMEDRIVITGDSSDCVCKRYYKKTFRVWYEKFYQKSFQDAFVELLRFDFNIEESADISPRKVEYLQVERISSTDPAMPAIGVGDSLMIHYSNNFENENILEGNFKYSNLELVFWSGGSGTINRGAGMVNEWNSQFSGVSPVVGEPQGTFDISGTTAIDDLMNRVELNVRAEVTLRGNATGEGTIWVNEVERARIVFESYDTGFHGHFSYRSRNFARDIAF